MSFMRTDDAEHGRRVASAAERNKDAILSILRGALPASGLVIEVASGTGQHVVHFARALPDLVWQPSDPDPGHRASIAAWTAHEKLANVRAPLDLDVSLADWPVDRADAVVCINLVHIAPWAATAALVRGAARLLEPGGVLFLYGPYRRFGAHTAPSNEAFDASLRATNPEWGVRDLEAVVEIAEQADLRLAEVAGMPANNFAVVFRKGRRVSADS